jgi:uncharacterized membrane-anchored protein
MDKETEFQTGWSAFLMVAIAILIPVYVGIGSAGGDDKLFIGLLFFPALTVLYIGYLLTYRGKAHRSSRVGFVASLTATILVLFLFVYVVGLAKSFTH